MPSAETTKYDNQYGRYMHDVMVANRAVEGNQGKYSKLRTQLDPNDAKYMKESGPFGNGTYGTPPRQHNEAWTQGHAPTLGERARDVDRHARQSVEGGISSIKKWLQGHSKDEWFGQLGRRATSEPSPPRFNTGHPSPEGAKGNDELRNQLFKGLADDQNAWMGMGGGAGFGMVKKLRDTEGAGEEVVRRLLMRGVTPEALDKILMRRGVDLDARHHIRQNYRAAGDLTAEKRMLNGEVLEMPMRQTVAGLGRDEEGLRNTVNYPSEQLAEKFPGTRESEFQGKLKHGGAMESVTRGNITADVVPKIAGRMMNKPEFNFKKSEYGPPDRVTDAEYYQDKPIQSPYRSLIDVPRQADNQGLRQAYNDRLDRYNFGRTGWSE
jgi:hypothetical protein